MDYKNTPEGKAVQNKYADLLPLSRPGPIKPRMSISNRAKIFPRLLLYAVMRMRLLLKERLT